MAKKTRSNGDGQDHEPSVEMKRQNVKVPEFFSVYANDIQVQTSPWDMRFILGEIDSPGTPDDPVVTIKQLGEFRISPQLANRLATIIAGQVQAYEQRFGAIPVLEKD